jgi:CheY-like chemotaxis protein
VWYTIADDLDPDGDMRADTPDLPRRDAERRHMLRSFPIPKGRRAPTSHACPSIQRRREAFDRFIQIFGIRGNECHRGTIKRNSRRPTLGRKPIPTAPKPQMNITNVLVVDDDIAMCRIVHHMLSNEQCKVQTCESVADALAAIEQKAFDIYVMDYKLPDGSGLDVAERIRLKWGATPIIIISGYDASAVALRAEKLNISIFLEKPFSRDVIRDAVKKAIGSPRKAPELSPVSPAPSKPAKSRFWRH